jgi:hypothetical protein
VCSVKHVYNAISAQSFVYPVETCAWSQCRFVVTLLENRSAFSCVLCSALVWSGHFSIGSASLCASIFLSFFLFLSRQSISTTTELSFSPKAKRSLLFFPPCPFVCIVTLSSGFVRCCVVKFIQAS